jgi:membrane-associated phospholipid phosphatase
MAAISLAVVAVSIWGLYATQITVSLGQLLPRLALLVVLLAGVAFYRWRREEKLLNVILMTFWAVLITNLHMFPMFIAARQKAPLCDDLLARLDAACGIEVPDVLRIMEDHPTVGRLLEVAYGTLTLLMTLAVMVPPLCGRMDRAKEFALGVMVSALICMPLFAVVQAVGPWAHYGYAPTPGQERYMTAFFKLKSEAPFALDLSYGEGLITFPSFHAILAILAALALRSTAYLRWPVAVLAALIVVSTVTTGWHYPMDVLAGIVVAAVAVGVANGYLWLEAGRNRAAVARPLRLAVQPPHRHLEQPTAATAS